MEERNLDVRAIRAEVVDVLTTGLLTLLKNPHLRNGAQPGSRHRRRQRRSLVNHPGGTDSPGDPNMR